MRPRSLVLTCLLTLPLSACGGLQSPLDPQGPQAATLAWLFWTFTGIVTVVWLLTMTALIGALWPRARRAEAPLDIEIGRERRMTYAVGGAVAVTSAVVLTLTGLSYAGQTFLIFNRPDELTLKITGHQWWWDIRYESPDPAKVFTTANEIHIPAGEQVTLILTSSDVIHSFWVPNLGGKLDLIPGIDNRLQLTASLPGVYRGQCAEFCGYQHAHMGLLLIAHPLEEFEAWREIQLRAASPPQEDERRRGESVFLTKPCALCHTVRGTMAGGRLGPDLTHLASRRTIASAMLPLTRGSLAAWIVDPQSIKPGVHMPMTRLGAEEIDPLLSYLMGLQ
jgi:cytochrome c oxidase subunit II